MRAESEHRRGHAAAAGGDERFVEINVGGGERRLQRVALFPGAVGVEQLAMRQAARAGDMAGGDAGARVAVFAGEARGGARNDGLLGLARQIFERLYLVSRRLLSAHKREGAVARCMGALFGWATPPV